MLNLRIVSPEKVVYDGRVMRVVVPGTLGNLKYWRIMLLLYLPWKKGL